MKAAFTFLAFSICIQLFACDQYNKMTNSANNISDTSSTKMKITIGTISFTATLYNNETASAFKTKLPMTINMTELNGNEKYFNLPAGLPANASNPGTIQAGDLMLYGVNTLVLFYRSFSTSYNYSRLARIDDASGLATVLGSGTVTVTIALQ